MLGDQHRDRRQLRDLTPPRPPRRQLLRRAEHVPAASAAFGVVIDKLVDLILRQQRTAGALMPGLAAGTPLLPVPRQKLLRLRPRLRTPLLPRPRGILRRRLRPRPRTLPPLLLKPRHPLHQQTDLALVASSHLKQELNARLTTRVIDRLSLRPLHTTQFDKRTEDPLSKTGNNRTGSTTERVLVYLLLQGFR